MKSATLDDDLFVEGEPTIKSATLDPEDDPIGRFSAEERGNPDLMAARVNQYLAKTTQGLIEAAAFVNSARQACNRNGDEGAEDWHRFLKLCRWDPERDRKHVEALVLVGSQAQVLWGYADVLPRSLYTLRFLCSRRDDLRILLKELRAKKLLSPGLTMDGLKHALGIKRGAQSAKGEAKPYLVALLPESACTPLHLAAVAMHCVLQHAEGRDYSVPFEHIRSATWLKPFLEAVAQTTSYDTKPLIDAIGGEADAAAAEPTVAPAPGTFAATRFAPSKLRVAPAGKPGPDDGSEWVV